MQELYLQVYLEKDNILLLIKPVVELKLGLSLAEFGPHKIGPKYQHINPIVWYNII
jgi:hypothetical protein